VKPSLTIALFACGSSLSLGALSRDDPRLQEPKERPATARSVEATVAGLDAQRRALEDQLRSLAGRAQALEAFTTARGRAYVRLSRAGLLPIGNGFSALVDHATRLERLRRALGRDQAEASAVSAERQRLAAVLGEIEGRRALLEEERVSLVRAHAVIAAAEEREVAFQRAFTSSFQPSHTAVYGSGDPDAPSSQGLSFAAARGRMPFPLSGRTEIRRAERGASGPGLEMAAPLGSAVRVIHGGRVAFADEYADLGRTVLVDHGEGYFTLYAGLDGLDVPAGREVRGGEPIGRVGSSGTVYVEVRRGQETLEPAPWFGL
jgi:murein hydrolase activator